MGRFELFKVSVVKFYFLGPNILAVTLEINKILKNT